MLNFLQVTPVSPHKRRGANHILGSKRTFKRWDMHVLDEMMNASKVVCDGEVILIKVQSREVNAFDTF